MSDFAGVDPRRVRQLADRLKDLADTLDREGAAIRQLFSDWNGQINQSLLSQQGTQVHDDARNMSRRADEALNLLHQTRIVDPNGPHPDWITIPWDVSQINTTIEAQQEEADLKQAMNNPNDPQSRATIAEVAQSLADHQDDPAYLQAFMAVGGLDDATRAARVLHGQDGTHNGVVLSQASEKILAEFGQGVQAATTLAQQGKIQLPSGYLQKLTQPTGGDMWSVSMLFKHGPPGDKWDSTVLSAVGGAMLDWRSKQEMRPGYSAPDFSIGSPGGYVEDKKAWYKSLGLSVDYLTVGSGDAANNIPGIDANDPSLILMQRVSENADASRALLTGNDGATHARELVSYKWQTPGPQSFDDAKWPAAVITAATSDRTNHSEQSMQAAVNIINAGADEYNVEKGLDGYTKEQYPGTPPTAITHALSLVFSDYVPDFAASHGLPNDQRAKPAGDSTDPYMLLVGRQTTEDFLSEIMRNKADAGNIVNAVNAQMSLTAARGMNTSDAQTYLQNLAELRGEVSAAGKHVNLDAAALVDAAHQNQIMWLNAVGGFVASIPANVPLDFVKATIWGALPIASAAYSTNNAAAVEQNSKAQFFDDSTSMRVAVVQGLALSGKVQPPANHPEWANGNIVLTSEDDKTDFDRWWLKIASQNGGQMDNFDDHMRDGFNRGATQ